MKAPELLVLNLKTVYRSRKVWLPFLEILFLAGFLISTLLSMKTAYFRLNDLGIGNITGHSDAVYYFNSPSQLKEGLTLDDDDRFEILFLWAVTGKTMEKNPVNVRSYQDLEHIPVRLIQGRQPASSKEVLLNSTWAARNGKEPGDTIEITEPDGNNPGLMTVTGIYESPANGEDLISVLDLDHLGESQSQGQISLKKGKRFEEGQMVSLPAGLVMDDFSQQQSSSKELLLQFAVPFFMILILCFSIFVLIYSRILKQEKKEMMTQLQILGLSGKDKKLIHWMDNDLVPLVLFSSGVLVSAGICSVLLNENIVQVLFPGYRILSGQYNYPCSLSRQDWWILLILILLLPLMAWGISFLEPHQFRQNQNSLHTERTYAIPVYRQGLKRIQGRTLILLLVVLLQFLWQFSSQSFLSWLQFFQQDSRNEDRITVQLNSQNMTGKDLEFLESLADDYTETGGFLLSVDPNSWIAGAAVTAIPDQSFEELWKQTSSAENDSVRVISQNPLLSGRQTVQVETAAVRQSKMTEVSACMVDDYGLYQTEDSHDRILISFDTLKSWLDENDSLPAGEGSDWYAGADIQIDSADPVATAQKIEQNAELYDLFRVNLINNSASFRMQKTRETILISFSLIVGVLILLCGLYTFYLILKGSLEKYRRDFEIYRSLGLPVRVLKQELLRQYCIIYLAGSGISSLLLLLVHSGWLNPGWIIFLGLMFLFYLLSIHTAIHGFWPAKSRSGNRNH